jgi:hypothetical protein
MAEAPLPTRGRAAEWLRAKLEPLLAELELRMRRIAELENPQRAYAKLLRLHYSEVRASLPLLLTAERVVVERGPEDRVGAGMVSWLREHAAEELHHDEWLVEDYAAIGGTPDELLNLPGSPTVAALVGSVYYWILHAHPVAILGYYAVLEGSSPSQTLIDKLEASTGYPAGAFTTLRRESDIRMAHDNEVFDLIDELPLTSDQKELISMTALQTADLLIHMADELLDSAAG